MCSAQPEQIPSGHIRPPLHLAQAPAGCSHQQGRQLLRAPLVGSHTYVIVCFRSGLNRQLESGQRVAAEVNSPRTSRCACDGQGALCEVLLWAGWPSDTRLRRKIPCHLLTAGPYGSCRVINGLSAYKVCRLATMASTSSCRRLLPCLLRRSSRKGWSGVSYVWGYAWKSRSHRWHVEIQKEVSICRSA